MTPQCNKEGRPRREAGNSWTVEIRRTNPRDGGELGGDVGDSNFWSCSSSVCYYCVAMKLAILLMTDEWTMLLWWMIAHDECSSGGRLRVASYYIKHG
jgi:hypothetical protein